MAFAFKNFEGKRSDGKESKGVAKWSKENIQFVALSNLGFERKKKTAPVERAPCYVKS